MRVAVQFYSYFKDLTACTSTEAELPAGATVGELQAHLIQRFPRLAEMKRSTLIAVGVEYQSADYVLREGDSISLFPPVQGG